MIRFVDDWEVQLSVSLGVESNQLLAVMHDRASVNGAAMRIMKVVYPNMVDIGCISHILDIVGNKFKTPNLHHFFHSLEFSIFSQFQSKSCMETTNRQSNAIGYDS